MASNPERERRGLASEGNRESLAKDRERRDRENRDANRGLKAGYMSGNAYPGYRGPTGTRNPRARPEKAPTKGAQFSPGDKPRPSIWERVFQPRRTPNPTPSYKATLHNIGVLSGLTPGPALPAKIAGMIAGLGPQFEDYTGMKMGPGDWDPKDKIAPSGLPDFASIFYNREPH